MGRRSERVLMMKILPAPGAAPVVVLEASTDRAGAAAFAVGDLAIVGKTKREGRIWQSGERVSASHAAWACLNLLRLLSLKLSGGSDPYPLFTYTYNIVARQNIV